MTSLNVLIPHGAKYFEITHPRTSVICIVFYQDCEPQPAGSKCYPIEELRDHFEPRPDIDAVLEIIRVMPFPGREKPRNKYDREILPDVWVDVYDVLGAFTGKISALIKPAIDHALKKLLAPGLRGVKEERQDLIEARDSIDRAIQKLDEWA